MDLSASIEKALARRSFAKFIRWMQPEYEFTPCHTAMVRHIQRLIDGDLKRGAIAAAPQHGKSTLINIYLPAFLFGTNPRVRMIAVSYGAELSEIFGRRLRNVMNDPRYVELFPQTKISQDSNAAYRFETTLGGEYSCVGKGGAVSGKSADWLLVDDLVRDSREAASESINKGDIEWLDSTLLTRLSPRGRIVHIGTRWTETDCAAWLIKQRGFDVLTLPAIAGTNDPAGRKLGEAFWPSHYPIEWLEAKRAENPRVFCAMYMGRPGDAQGDIFKRQWFKTYIPSAADHYSKIITSWDTAYGKNSNSGDFSVGITIGQKKNGFDILGLVRGRWPFAELKAKIASEADFWHPDEILIEDQGSGTVAIQALTEDTPYPIIPIKADKSKELRAQSVSPLFESGRVFFPENADWVEGLQEELVSFPYQCEHDDRVDSLVQGLIRLRGAVGIYGVLDYNAGIKAGTIREAIPFPAQPVPVQSVQSQPVRSGDGCPKCGATDCQSRIGGVGIRCGQCGTQYNNNARISRVMRDGSTGRVVRM